MDFICSLSLIWSNFELAYKINYNLKQQFLQYFPPLECIRRTCFTTVPFVLSVSRFVTYNCSTTTEESILQSDPFYSLIMFIVHFALYKVFFLLSDSKSYIQTLEQRPEFSNFWINFQMVISSWLLQLMSSINWKKLINLEKMKICFVISLSFVITLPAFNITFFGWI